MDRCKKDLTFIDLFAGAGGLSEGFIKAGFRPVAHIEMDSDACNTIKTRLAYHYLKANNKVDLYIKYLKGILNREEFYNEIPDELLESVINKEITSKTKRNIFNSIKKIQTTNKIDNIDVIIGGPPCQAYSTIGKSKKIGELRKLQNKKADRDPRYYLYKLYVEFIKEFKPKVFVFENVPGLLSPTNKKYFERLRTACFKIGYTLEYRKLNASEFGVLQNRNRIIIIGWQNELGLNYPSFEKTNINYKISDLLEDLPRLNPGDGLRTTAYKNLPSEYIMKCEIRDGFDFVTQHITRPHNEQDLKIYEIAIDKWLNYHERIKYSDIPEELRTHNNIGSFLDRFKVVDKNGLSHTIVAHISKDGHYYIYPDLYQIRSLSIREAARIQSFPDNYFFEGSRTSIFRQIGNAVPPLMSNEIAKRIRELL